LLSLKNVEEKSSNPNEKRFLNVNECVCVKRVGWNVQMGLSLMKCNIVELVAN